LVDRIVARYVRFTRRVFFNPIIRGLSVANVGEIKSA
jgi:hypothetical protein